MPKKLPTELRVCPVCGTTFEVRINLPKKYCSRKCGYISPDRQLKYQQTCLDKYGTTNVAKSTEVRKKISNSLIGKVDNTAAVKASQSIEIKVKRSATVKQKYGVDHVFQNTDIIKKIKNTTFLNHGVYNISQSDNIKKKKSETLFKNYGVSSSLQSSEILQKARTTNYQRNGSETYNNRDKSKETTLKKYNVENISQAKHIREMFDKRFYDSIFENRLVYNVEPTFTIEEFEGINIGKKYKFKCLDCGDIFETDIAFNKIPRCPKCHKHKSRYEQELITFIKSLDTTIRIESGDRKLIYPYELDIYLPDYKIAIEFNGLYWHTESHGCDKNYHVNKTDKCGDVGIRLIHVFEDEWLHKRSLVENRLKHILGHADKRIYARQCEIQLIDSKTKNNFLNEIHLQGKDTASVYYGLYYGSELVSVMTFGRQRIIMGKKPSNNKWELYRFANKYNVIGSAGKLLKRFIHDYTPSQILTYSDRRWNTGELYETIGFTYVGKTEPNYWYVVNGKREYRFNYRKSVLKDKLQIYDQTLSESKNMKLNGYDKIWDCGSLKYQLILQ